MIKEIHIQCMMRQDKVDNSFLLKDGGDLVSTLVFRWYLYALTSKDRSIAGYTNKRSVRSRALFMASEG
jgi:hypothetical protein